MPKLSYQQAGLVLRKGESEASQGQIRDLQYDLRRLGYLGTGIDGVFGATTETAVMSLKYDLLYQDGKSLGDDGDAPLVIRNYNRGRIIAITGSVDQALADCMADLLKDPSYLMLPRAYDPAAENRLIIEQIKSLTGYQVPIPFLTALLNEENGLKHFHVSSRDDEDDFIMVSLDAHHPDLKYAITSRGYGIGRYTLFHHPPRLEEIRKIMLDIRGNLAKTIQTLRMAFDLFVNGPHPGMKADDRIAEAGPGPLRICQYDPLDSRYLRDCKNCLQNAGKMDIQAGLTPIFEGAGQVFRPTPAYADADYEAVPIRKNIKCDWPYAIRRCRGGGLNSYHFQVRVLHDALTLEI